jgi:hypothetical protein
MKLFAATRSKALQIDAAYSNAKKASKFIASHSEK